MKCGQFIITGFDRVTSHFYFRTITNGWLKDDSTSNAARVSDTIEDLIFVYWPSKYYLYK